MILKEMEEPAQTLLIFVIATLTIILTAIGVQLFLILNEIRQMVAKMNKMLGEAGLALTSFTKPLASFSNAVTSLSGMARFFDWIIEKIDQRKEKAKPANFFLRHGKPLAKVI